MIANLRAVLGLDSKGFKAGVKGADREAQSFRSRISGIGKAIGVAFSVGAVLQFGRALASWASDIVHAARNANLLTSEMMALNRVVEAAGGTTREAQNIFARFSAEVGEAIFQGNEMKDGYVALGLSVKNLAGRDDFERLQMLARAIRDAENPTRTLIDLFGVRGANMRASFEAIANGLDNVSDASARAAENAERLATEYGTAIDKMKEFFLTLVMSPSAGPRRYAQDADTLRRELEARRRAMDETNAMEAASARERERLADERFRRLLETEAREVAAAQAAQDANDRLERARLDGLERMEAEHKAALNEIQRQMKGAAYEEQRILYERFHMLKKHYKEDVEEFKKAEQEKLAAQRGLLQAQVNRARERSQSEIARTRGEGVQADALAQHGGFMGGGRAGLAVEDRVLKVNAEQLRVLSEIKPLIQRMKEIAEMESDVAGGL